jgi:hypothetical protein
MDPTTQLLNSLVAGATIAGAELVKEGTKDAYWALKSAVTSVFGRRAERALEAVEGSPGDEAAKLVLKDTLPAADPRDAAELGEKVIALLEAIKTDQAAMRIVDEVARIRLDVEAGGNVILEDLRGARQIDVRSKSAGDFTMRSVDMDKGKQPGNR